MQNALKLFGEKDIDSFERTFVRSRLSLTLFYVLVLAIVLAASSGIARGLFSRRLEARFRPVLIESDGVPREAIVPLPPDPNLVRKDLRDALFLVDGSLLILGAAASYLFAGMTLYPIRRAYQAQRQFLSDASHELRTPLAILEVNLENDRRNAKDEDVRASIESHLEEVHRMSVLVQDLLTLSRGGERASTATPVSLPMLTHDVVTRLLPLANDHTVRLVEGASVEDLFVFVNQEEVSRAVVNIIKNAILYNRPGGSVTVSLAKKGSQAELTIQDTGISMTPEEVSRAFDRFYRAEQSRSRETGGSGLGLSIAKSVVEAAGGSLSLVSTKEKGTTVTILLPIHIAS